MDIPKTWEEFVDMTYIGYMSLFSTQIQKLYRDRAIKEKGFHYDGYYYEKGGKIYRCFFNGVKTLLFKDLSIKQMFVFIENLENKNFLEEVK